MKTVSMLALLMLATAGCDRASVAPGADTRPGAESAPESEPAGLPTRVTLAPEVQAAAGVKTAPVQSEVLPARLELIGEVAADPDLTAELSSPAAGRIASVSVKEGERVAKGAVAVVLEVPELARARAALLSATARAEAARLNATRLTRLAEKGLAAGQEAKDAQAEASSLAAEAGAHRQALAAYGSGLGTSGGARLELRSPLDGFVVFRSGVAGENVEARRLLVRIIDFDRAWFLARLFEKDLGRVREGAKAEVRLNAWPEDALPGKVESIGRQVDPAARTVVARVVLEGEGAKLRAGLFGKAFIALGGPDPLEPRPVVPLSAVTRLEDQRVVFVKHAEGDFEVHKVELGASAEGKVEVLSGLRAGEQVAVDGVFTLKSAVLRSTFGEEE